MSTSTLSPRHSLAAFRSPTTWRDAGFYGAIAALLNAFFLFPIFGGLYLHIGEAVLLLCLKRRGWQPTLLAVIPSTAALHWSADAFAFWITIPLELAVLAILIRRGMPLLAASLLYWLLIGTPISLWLIHAYSSMDDALVLVALLKQPLNGLLYASLAAALYLLSLRLGRSRPEDRPALASQVSALSSVSVVLPAMLLGLVLTQVSADRLYQALGNRLSDRADSTAERIDSYVEEHSRVVGLLATLAVSDIDRSLSATEASFPGFITMLRAASDGSIEFGVPTDFYQRLRQAPKAAQTVSDREYFRAARDRGTVFVSDVIQGRGFGSDPIVAVSAPLLRDGKFIGIVEGSLNLPNFSELETSPNEDDAGLIVIDSAGQVIYASSATGIAPLSSWSKTWFSEHPGFQGERLLQFGEHSYLFRSAVTAQGWTIYNLTDAAAVNLLIRDNMLLLMLSLVPLMILFLLVARAFAKRVSAPLVRLHQQLDRGTDRITPPAAPWISKEITTLGTSLARAQELAVDFRERLESEVAEKTRALNLANARLKQLAQEDALTQVCNRRGFERLVHEKIAIATRHGLNVCLAVVDIDNFKQVNDRYGHQSGDECLKIVAQALKQSFRRDSDVIGRLGGEEFAIFHLGDDPSGQLDRIEGACAGIAHIRPEIGDHRLRLTVSCGAVGERAHSGTSYEHLFAEADRLLYVSKNSGKNQTQKSLLSAEA